ncbi:MAG TPA: hypothetical protein VKR52_09830 [Terracidiphilus sp.]|nr:hypothetical protein [Terracidiphilus sp.]
MPALKALGSVWKSPNDASSGLLDSHAAPDPIDFAANVLFRRGGLQGVSATAAP